jgi:predicted  nucleic acid-binding Zn-ribbon protein
VRLFHSIPLIVLSAATFAACDNGTKQQLATLTTTDSLRVDSLSNVRKELLEEVMTSTQFVNQINTELAKARAIAAKPAPQLESTAEMSQVNDQRKAVVARIAHLVARLDSVQTRLASTRARAQQMSKKDSALVEQVAAYEKSVADLQAAAEHQRAQFQTVIDSQTVRIASLGKSIDTLNTVRVALVDTVTHLVAEKNTAYYVVGTKDELIKKGILAAEGQKRFLLVGSRNVSPARELDPANFTKIDRLADRTIKLPEGEYTILSRQNPAYVTPQAQKDGKMAGALTIDQPERFWEASRFLIIVRS